MELTIKVHDTLAEVLPSAMEKTSRVCRTRRRKGGCRADRTGRSHLGGSFWDGGWWGTPAFSKGQAGWSVKMKCWLRR